MWSSKIQKNNGDETFVFSGRAYPQVLAGKNPTDIVTSDVKDREAFYRDPAIKISDAFLDNCNGTEGFPICVEHNVEDVRGTIHHTFIGDGNKRGLKIIAHIPIKRNGIIIPQGVEAKEGIISGKYKGLSVGYGNELITASRNGAITKVNAKIFREISLVKEPFFDDCKLSWNVQASKKGINNLDYNLNPDNSFFIEIKMSESQVTAPGTTSTPSPTNDAVPGHELLMETDKLKTALNNESSNRQSLEKKAADMEARLKDYESKLAIFAEKERQEAEAYAKQQLPKYESYIQALTASKAGARLSEDDKAGFKKTFTDIRMKKAAEFYEAQYADMMEVKASREKEEAEKKALKDELEKLKQTTNTTVRMLSNARTGFATALDHTATNDAIPKEVDVSASKTSTNLKLSDMMTVPAPSIAELPFLKQHRYAAAGDVTASAYGNGERPYVSEIPVAATSRLHLNEEGELNFPESARNVPGCDVFFHWMCNNDELRTGDLSDIVRVSAQHNKIKRLDGEDWENRHQQQVAGQ